VIIDRNLLDQRSSPSKLAGSRGEKNLPARYGATDPAEFDERRRR
jgi:hypothetical protein